MIVTNLVSNIVFILPLEIVKLIQYLNRKGNYVLNKVIIKSFSVVLKIRIEFIVGENLKSFLSESLFDK